MWKALLTFHKVSSGFKTAPQRVWLRGGEEGEIRILSTAHNDLNNNPDNTHGHKIVCDMVIRVYMCSWLGL